MAWEKGRFVAAVTVGCVTAQLSGIAVAQSARQVWSYESDGSWLPETVSLGNEGTQVFVEFGAFANSRALFSTHDSDPPTAVWTDQQVEFNFNRTVASSAQYGTHAAMHQEFIDAQQSWKHAILRLYSSSSATPDWSYEFDTPIYNTEHSKVRVSSDGSRIVGAVYDAGTMTTDVTVFDASSPTPVLDITVNTFGAPVGLVVSADGTTAAFRSTMRFLIVDLQTGAALHDEFITNGSFSGGLACSPEGRRIIMASGSSVLSYQRTVGGSYAVSSLATLGVGETVAKVALSANGHALYYSVNNSLQKGMAGLRGLDLVTGASLVNYTVDGGGNLLNLASGLTVSADGGRAALALWGDEFGNVPELMFFQAGFDAPVATQDLPGSVVSLDMSPGGEHVAAAVRACHATQFGQGGSFRVFEAPEVDLVLEGVPSVGSTVTLHQRLNGSALARVLVSPVLAQAPTVFPGAGALYLERELLSWLPTGTVTGNEIVTPFQIPADSSWVGSSVYFQGLGLAPRDLSDNFVKLTVLP
ncbi:MAG: hypothetical protein H6828_12345 [Planctomycetes bacterium]|nr:hypothetical protein [Planctomycetota bacterium]